MKQKTVTGSFKSNNPPALAPLAPPHASPSIRYGQHLTRISAHLRPLPNEQMEKFWDVLGGLAPGTNTTDVAFDSNPYEMLPISPSYTHFLGSLTTPPCSEVHIRETTDVLKKRM